VNRIHALYGHDDTAPHHDPLRPTALSQRRARAARRKIRIAIVAFRRWIARFHQQHYDTASLLDLHPRTLARWERLWVASKLRSKPRGRPLVAAYVPDRNQVIHLLDCIGPHIGCSTLELFFPLMSRRELRRLLLRYRRVWRKRNRLQLHELRWHRPGSVWAIDYTDPPAPIDNLYTSILIVRDLASGYQLLALPTTDESAKTACAALLPLFRQFGPPLLLKSDNGSFRAHEMTRLLDDWNVCRLLSPPRTPTYNGAVEAGIGSIKTRTHHIATQHGRPGEWTCDDLEAARLLANATARPHGRAGPTPQAAWNRRQQIPLADRNLFFDTLRRFQQKLDQSNRVGTPAPGDNDALPQHHQATEPTTGRKPEAAGRLDTEMAADRSATKDCNLPGSDHKLVPAASLELEPSAPPPRDAALFHRIAIRRALVARGLLTLSKPRRITPPIKSQKVDNIT